MQIKPVILIAEDDESLAEVLQDSFRDHNFKVYYTDNGADACHLFQAHFINIILLDIDLPEKNGWEVLSEIRKKDQLIPVILMTGKHVDEKDGIRSYKIGSDYFLRKPFYPSELITMVESKLKIHSFSETSLQIGNSFLDLQNNRLVTNGTLHQLTDRETEVLLLLIKNKNQLVNARFILNSVWKNDHFNNLQMLRNLIVDLRKKISEDPDLDMETVYAKGYKLKEEIGN
jgi:DNA-binding response OmpR family regulator